ncbi:MAG: carboxypeptidase regulatory-like domain-containing protein [Vicinamibacterales bacterium]
MKRASVLFAAVLLLCLAITPPLWAQAVSTAQISGVVRDPSGGVLPGVEVTALKTDTGLTRTTFTGEDGSYTLPNLPVGPYKLTVVLQGFNTFVREGIVLQVQSNPTIDVTLTVGGMSETITVVANSEMVETRSTAVGQLINNEQVVEMPLNGRQVTELIFLSGLATPAPSGDLNTNKNYPTVTISVAGGQANGMTYIMDGGTFNDPFNNLNLPTPNPDALQEFKVESSALPARYGHHAASAVNVVTKSGTNTFRGNAFEFMRDYHLNARNAFATEKDSLKRNQFGGTLGGPIKTDKLFFFASYQGTTLKTKPAEIIRYVPTQAMLNGDFTTFASAACNTRGAVTLKAPFVNNRVDPSQFSKAALAILKYVPVADDPCGKVQFGVKDDSSDNQALGKIDYTISKAQTLTGRYLFARYYNPVEYDGKNVLMITRTGRENIVHSAVVGHNWILGTNAVNSFHFTFNKTLNDRPLPEYFAPKDVGINVDNDPRIVRFMGISISSGFNLGSGGTNPGYFNSTGWQIANDFDYIVGKHQFSAGVSVIKTKIETTNNRPTNGQFSFNGSILGLGLADFMLGRMSSFMQGNMVWDYHHHLYYGAYVQDDWKPRSNLTINYGLRWEPFNPIQNTAGYSNHFSKEWFDQGRRSKMFPQAPAGLMFPGDEGYPKGTGTHGARYGQFAPRVGVIWSPLKDNSMSVRGAWGMFYDTPHLFFNTRFSNNPPWGAQISLGATSLEDPWSVYAGGNPFPALRQGWREAAFPLYGVYVTTPLDLHNTRLQQWNFSIQKGFGDLLFAASYLGNKGKYVWRAYEANPAVYIEGASTIANTNTRRLLYLQNKTEGQYYSTIGTTDDTGRSMYHGLLLSAQKRMSNNWSILTNYTLSKCMSDPATTEITGATTMNPWNKDLDYSYCGSDRRHVWNVSAVARTPQFEGRLGKVLSDWQVAPIVRWMSGDRSTVTTGTDVALTGTGNQRAVQILDNPYGDGTPKFYLNPAAFARPATGTYSTDKPFTIVNPSRFQNDVSISRTFNLGGVRTLQFRWEVFNLINHVNLDAPSTSLNSSTFGQITSAQDPRMMQIAFKFAF